LITCPECGANKIRESVSLCEVCEISQRYEKRLEQLQALLDLAKTMRDAAAKERDFARYQSRAESGQACALLTEIMDLYPYMNCVCGRNKPRLPETLRESARAVLKTSAA
jgi:hypothetical protein